MSTIEKTTAAPAPPPGRRIAAPAWSGTALGVGTATIFLSAVVLIPLAAVLWEGTSQGPAAFWDAITTPDAWAALKLTVIASLVVALINLVMGTLIAWVLVRDDFPGKGLIDLLIDLPFALPTIVAGLVLLTLYGDDSPLGVSLAYTRAGVVVALLFVTLPFVVRTVQPVLLELDREMEQAAASLGAGPWTIFRRIILPNLVPAMLAGTALAFTRAISEFGSTVLISGNVPFKTQVSAVHIFGQIESDNTAAAAATSTALLVLSLVFLLAIDLVRRWGARHG
ncbi:sulfate ABC transporter permease subunit CysT [Actinomadura madurae]|uniref:Sulfate transport system permease protein CysT n=1 Tax=Actinomadura madurae TaxID=1993 RepID=A0A1I5QTF1_9ACTN|nr:sulfate ABC transporter permease subunit CysT [Actinomadura madurae]SFP49525.1 sulfate transport system permease protein [Actinomadura madurae]SPT58773.1 Sulfate transport system permease protein CysW [Actinomadura madurae]